MNKMICIILIVVLSGCSSDYFWTEEDFEEYELGYQMGYEAEDSDDYSRYKSDTFIDGYEEGQYYGDCEYYQLKKQWDNFSQEECAENFDLEYPGDGIRGLNFIDNSCYKKFKSNEVNWHNCLGYSKNSIYAKFKKGLADGYGIQRFPEGIYYGEFKRSTWHGAGKVVWNDGTYSKGNYRHNKAHGIIFLYNKQDQLISSANYNNGKKIVYPTSRTNPKNKTNDDLIELLNLLYILRGY